MPHQRSYALYRKTSRGGHQPRSSLIRARIQKSAGKIVARLGNVNVFKSEVVYQYRKR